MNVSVATLKIARNYQDFFGFKRYDVTRFAFGETLVTKYHEYLEKWK